MGLADPRKGTRKIGKQEDVAIDVAQEVVAGDLLGALKNPVNALGTKFIGFYVRLVTKTEFGASFCGAFFSTKNDDFYIWEKGFPAAKCVALRDFNVVTKRFWRSEKSQHLKSCPDCLAV